MTLMHHVAKDTDQRTQCLYCKDSLLNNRWKSEFCEDKHYKVTKCKCGKKARILVDFHGTGHDDWEKDSTLENKIEIIE